MADYRPIDCDIHDHYELAIIKRRRLRLGWRDDAGRSRLGRVRPIDLMTRRGEEFLIFVDAAGTRHEVRLDLIQVATDPVGGTTVDPESDA